MRRRDLGNRAGAEHVREVLPDVDGVRMLAGRTAAALARNPDRKLQGPESQGCALKIPPQCSRVRAEMVATGPVLPGAQILFGDHGVVAERVIVADAGKKAGSFTRPKALRSQQDRARKRLFDDERAWAADWSSTALAIVRWLSGGVPMNTTSAGIAHRIARELQDDRLVPFAVARRDRCCSLARSSAAGSIVGQCDLPVETPRGIGEVIADRAGSDDPDRVHSVSRAKIGECF